LVTVHPLTGGNMGYVPNFRAIYEGEVAGKDNPFRYIRVTGLEFGSEWRDGGKALFLDDRDWGDRKRTGTMQLIMKPDWSARFRISTENWGYFKNVADEMGSDLIEAYDISFELPTIPSSGYKSSMTFSLRGDGMLGIWVDGSNDVGGLFKDSSPYGVNAFEDEAEFRDIDHPTTLTNGLMISFTRPFKDYTDTGTYTLQMNEMDDETLVQLLEIEELPNQPTRPVNPSSEHEPISEQDISNRYVYASGASAITGKTWTIEIGEYEGSFFVFYNGEAINFYSNEADARARADKLKAQAQRDADKTEEETETVTDVIPELPTFGQVGLIALAIVALIITVRR